MAPEEEERGCERGGHADAQKEVLRAGTSLITTKNATSLYRVTSVRETSLQSARESEEATRNRRQAAIRVPGVGFKATRSLCTAGHRCTKTETPNPRTNVAAAHHQNKRESAATFMHLTSSSL